MDGARYSTSCLSLFFATDMDLRAAGLDSGNIWYYEHADVDKIYSDGLTDALMSEDTPPGMFLTVTTFKDPSKMHASGPRRASHLRVLRVRGLPGLREMGQEPNTATARRNTMR